jgi:hypothetical protein
MNESREDLWGTEPDPFESQIEIDSFKRGVVDHKFHEGDYDYMPLFNDEHDLSPMGEFDTDPITTEEITQEIREEIVAESCMGEYDSVNRLEGGLYGHTTVRGPIQTEEKPMENHVDMLDWDNWEVEDDETITEENHVNVGDRSDSDESVLEEDDADGSSEVC